MTTAPDYTIVVGVAPTPTPLLDNLRRRMDRPGEAAVIATYAKAHTANSVATLYRQHRRSTPPGRWTFTSEKLPDGRGQLWATYLGP